MAKPKKHRTDWTVPEKWSWVDPIAPVVDTVESVGKSIGMPKSFLFNLLVIAGLVILWFSIKGEKRIFERPL